MTDEKGLCYTGSAHNFGMHIGVYSLSSKMGAGDCASFSFSLFFSSHSSSKREIKRKVTENGSNLMGMAHDHRRI